MRILSCVLIILALTVGVADARGGFSSGGSRGGFSSGRSFGGGSSFRSSPSYSRPSYSAPSRSYTSPTRGGFSSGSTFNSRPQTINRTTTTISRQRSFRGGSYMGGSPMMYPGFGMGYGYYGNNGLLTGLIIGSMIHPQGTTVYSGGGYSGQALMYPDGRVVNQQGYQVGNYVNGQFTAVDNGAMVAQPAPPVEQQDTTPIVLETGPSVAEVLGIIAITIVVIFIGCLLA